MECSSSKQRIAFLAMITYIGCPQLCGLSNLEMVTFFEHIIQSYLS